MPFTQGGSAAAGQIAVANLRPTGTYVAQVGGDPAVVGVNFRKTNAGAAGRIGASEERSALNRLEFFAGAVQMLDSVASATAFDVTKAHSGRLTTAVTLINESGLPANFGPGRGRWVTDDLPKVGINHGGTTGGAGVATLGYNLMITKSVVAGDLVIQIQNVAAATTVAEWFNASLVLSYEGHE
jgi:hypothetical protein